MNCHPRNPKEKGSFSENVSNLSLNQLFSVTSQDWSKAPMNKLAVVAGLDVIYTFNH